MILTLMLFVFIVLYALVGIAINDYSHNPILKESIPHEDTRKMLVFFFWPFFYTFILIYYVFRFLVVFFVTMLDMITKVESGVVPSKDDENED